MGHAWAGCDGGRHKDPQGHPGSNKYPTGCEAENGAVRGPGAACVPWSHHESRAGLGLESASPGLISSTIFYRLDDLDHS